VGGSVAYAEGFSTLMRNMREVHPTAMVVTPGLATRIHDKFYALVEKNNTETTVRRVIATTDPVRPFSARQALKERLLDEARMPFGGVLRRLFIVGGILPAAKAKGLRQVGMFVAQTYGHVLVAGPVAMTAPHAYRDGTAGKLLPHVRAELVTVDADGRGRLLLGTSDALVEGGSFALENGLAVTGDVALLSDDGYLSVLGREENLISRASGQVICPEELEAMLRQSPLVLEVAVVGVPTEDGGDTEPTAMILPDLAAAEEMLGESFETSLLEETLSEWITELNAPLMAEWRVAQFALADAPLPRDARGRICRGTVAEQLKQGLLAE
jgi:long-subunit acyl-CoA synthetase (AMP-forming)